MLQQLQTRLSDTDININQVVKEVSRVDKDFEKLNSEFRNCIRISSEISVKRHCKTYSTGPEVLFLYLSGYGYQTDCPSAECGT